ncbi:PA2169 family four-helix-bundle protein [Alteromonas oceanisediminis]|uniref:PA2169 family four-helix-bundle protein n=1 Tax=Alteromonas oceanisediminis TaxID=2836180 RepID=UPI001BDB1AA9|nr:PA2169 family four-helix-bundle protein [Alteromonas oceanisediminis]MBT0586674.1 PA2169 family four-helix-bundle protein [Alteromonas oceanisediminis]
MSKQVRDVEDVAEIIKVLNGGIEFYQDALTKIETPNVRSMFSRMIEEKQQAIASLQPFAIAEKGEVESGTSTAVDLRNMYTNVLGMFSSDKAHTYVDELEEVEDKVLEVMDKALEEDQPAACAAELRRIRARMQQCHDEMKALQEATS